jgi:hypothetical protein
VYGDFFPDIPVEGFDGAVRFIVKSDSVHATSLSGIGQPVQPVGGASYPETKNPRPLLGRGQ